MISHFEFDGYSRIKRRNVAWLEIRRGIKDKAVNAFD